ncbi:MAG: SAM-dependent methyltransferase [Treponema sp.]
MQAALYLIPVTLSDAPIAHVIPAYNIELLKTIRHYIVENRRSAIRFLVKADKEIDIDSLTFFELNEHTDISSAERYLDPIAHGNSIGVISEAGCPAVADPGAAVVALAHKRNIKVVPLAGPSSVIMSLMASGFNGQNFAFNGYLPAKPAERAAAVRALEQKTYRHGQTQIFIETPYRNAKMIETILHACRPETKLCIAAGLTGEDELIRTKTIAEWKKLPAHERELGKIPAIFLLFR